MTLPNWFAESSAPLFFNEYLQEFKDKPVNFLQIGVFTGDATEWLFKNILTHPYASLTDVDTWEGSSGEGHEQFNWKDIETNYDKRFAKELAEKKLIKVKDTSNNFFARNTKKFDFVYVDGDHHAVPVFLDGVNGFQCLNSGGILAFDDYLWTLGQFPASDPKPGIHAFLNIFGGQYSIIDIRGQAWIRKN